MTAPNRPLSPHLQVYRWPLNMATSILHRATGIALAVGTLMLVWWLVALVRGPETYDAYQQVIGSFIGRLFLFGWTWALFFHLCNGIRHLFWDAGLGFERNQYSATGWIVLVGASLLTLAVWVAGYAELGAW
jgi:succinate dehydrogenase / fumarate reductase cytochrome b subunit